MTFFPSRVWRPRRSRRRQAPLRGELLERRLALSVSPNPGGMVVEDAAFARAAALVNATPLEEAQAIRWVVRMSPGTDVAAAAAVAGATATRPTGIVADTFIWEFPQAAAGSIPGTLSAATTNRSHGLVAAYPLVARQQQPRLVPNDPLFVNQWHLRNTGQGGGTAGEDADVTGVWNAYLGTGVTIAIVDDGLQHAHPDLVSHYVAAASYDFNDDDPDPTPISTDAHGTAAGGVAAATGNNGLGGSGAAPGASLAGLRLIAGPADDLMEATALTYALADIDIYSNSWGPDDSGTQVSGPGPLTLAALERGVTEGRGGLGAIYVWSAGNGLDSNDNVNYDGYANSRFTIAVTAIDNQGRQSWYAEPGAAILVAAPSNGDTLGITTTDLVGTAGYNTATSAGGGDYTNTFGGTSSAAPLVSGVAALMLEANPNLGWRDVQHVLVDSARRNDPTDADWVQNGSGRWVNHKYGFGAVDAAAAVALSQTWTAVGAEVRASSGTRTVGLAIPDNNPTGVSTSFTMSADLAMEWVEVTFSATHSYRGDLEVVLTSPTGTQSVLAEQRGDSNADYGSWKFTSARHWGESSAGTWTLTVRDLSAADLGTLDSWSLDVYGTNPTDVVPTTVAITSDAGGTLTAGGSATVMFTVSEAVSTFTGGMVTATGGTLSGFAGSGTTYTATFTPAGGFEGVATIAIGAGAFTNGAGQPNEAAALDIAVDTVVPTVTVATTAGSTLLVGSTAAVSFALSEPAVSFSLASVTVTGGSLAGLTGSGTAYAATFTPAAGYQGAATIGVAAGGFTDLAGNDNAAGNTIAFTVDTVAPTLTISRSGSGTVTLGAAVTITFAASVATTTFTAADIGVTGGSLSGFAGTGSLYTASFTPAPGFQGLATIAVAGGSFTTGLGNPNQPASLSFPVDVAPPTLAITRSGSGTLLAGTVTTVTFTLSEVGTTFGPGGVAVSGGTLLAFAGGGTTFTATFTPTAGFEGLGWLAVAAGAFTDLVGQPNEAAVLEFPIDNLAPTIAVSWAGPAPLVSGAAATVLLSLSEPAAAFGLAAIEVAGGTLVNLTGAGTAFTATFLPAADFRGTATVTVPPGALTDIAGNRNPAPAAVVIPVDTVAPLIAGFRASPATARLGIGDAIVLEADFSEPVTPGGSLTVLLDTGRHVSLAVDALGLTARGVYVAQPGDVSGDLDVVAVSAIGLLRNAAGNPLATTLPPPAAGLAGRHAVVVDAAVRFVASGLFGIDPAVVRDARSQFRHVPLRFTTPVTGLVLAALRLELNGQPLSLQGARLTGSRDSYVLSLPVTRVNPVGIYTLSIASTGAVRAKSNGATATTSVALRWGFGRSVGMVPAAPPLVTPLEVVRTARRTSVVLAWQPAAANAGGPVSRYLLEYRIAGTQRWIAVRNSVPGGVSQTTVSGLALGHAYEFRVAAVNAAGQGVFGVSAPFHVA